MDSSTSLEAQFEGVLTLENRKEKKRERNGWKERGQKTKILRE